MKKGRRADFWKGHICQTLLIVDSNKYSSDVYTCRVFRSKGAIAMDRVRATMNIALTLIFSQKMVSFMKNDGLCQFREYISDYLPSPQFGQPEAFPSSPDDSSEILPHDPHSKTPFFMSIL